MVMRIFALYVLVEMAVIVALTATIGFGWTLIALIGTFVLGLVLAGSQLRRQLAKLQQGMKDPQGAVTDSALVALGSVLVFIPGLVTTVAGLLMLAPPTRAAMRPLAGLVAAKGLARQVTVINLGGGVPPRGRGQYIDGEVVDVHDDVPVDRPLEPKPE
ncbi:membrane protein FxsA [Mycobacterium sp. MS1601]|uniref:FxsA family protein n=1 Tax=Mycobacterium sp. MS1601 TaxID=1936029 RepID=UPI0009798397|nr:FxsA family protein [Mycobacterium sp. MS1601]AQA04976.1 membrane protein FxsA [Mycobacterium sp. MS1601]